MDKRQDIALKVMATLTFLLDENEESIDVGKIELDEINANDLFTGILMALTVIYNQLTTKSEDLVGMTYLLNRLALQHVMEALKAEKEGEENDEE